MANKKTLNDHIRERAEMYDAMSPGEIKAYDDLVRFKSESINFNGEKKQQTIEQANEYERQYTSFFILAVSFVVAGLLSSSPDTCATYATRVFHFSALVAGMTAAVVRFVELFIISRFYGKWLVALEKLTPYINGDNWTSPAQLNKHIIRAQRRLPKKSTKFLIIIELIVLIVALSFMGLWAFERSFNPDWFGAKIDPPRGFHIAAGCKK